MEKSTRPKEPIAAKKTALVTVIHENAAVRRRRIREGKSKKNEGRGSFRQKTSLQEKRGGGGGVLGKKKRRRSPFNPSLMSFLDSTRRYRRGRNSLNGQFGPHQGVLLHIP